MTLWGAKGLAGTMRHVATARHAATARWPRRTGSTMRAGLAGALLVLAQPLLAPAIGLEGASALADFRVCNEDGDTVGVAIGYYDGAQFVSEGWWHVDGDSCETLVSGGLASRFYYLYAENAERSKRWGGDIRMCTAEDEFKIEGVRDCIARGFARMGFGEYDTGEEASWTVRLTAENGLDDAAEGAVN